MKDGLRGKVPVLEDDLRQLGVEKPGFQDDERKRLAEGLIRIGYQKVVYCNKCRHWEEDDVDECYGNCSFDGVYSPGDWYCPHGEPLLRREAEE